MSGANMNTMPASASVAAIAVGLVSMTTPSASSTSALPERDVNDRLPCFATRTPMPAASSAAAVEMLNVVSVPPPVPHVSTSPSGLLAGSTTIASRSASTTPATSADVSPFTRNAMSSAATCAGVPSPRMMTLNARRSVSPSSDSRAARRRMACCNASVDTNDLEQPFRQRVARGDERYHESEQSHPLHILFGVDPSLRSISEIEYAHQLAVIHQRKADEASRRELLIAQESMLRRLAHVLHEQ